MAGSTNSNHNDADFREHRATYDAFIAVTKWGIAGSVVILIVVLWALHQL